jgi:hypothetical protein
MADENKPDAAEPYDDSEPALDQGDAVPREKKYLTGPLIRCSGKLGPRFPVDENPYDLIF